MQYIGFIFGIFGLLAYLELSSLKKRISDLERQMTAMQGTSYHEDRKALVKVARSCFNQKVNIDLKEDHQDVDIMMYETSGSFSVLYFSLKSIRSTSSRQVKFLE